MKAPLSQNEMEILDRQVATLDYQLSEIAQLLESRMGETDELAISARTVQADFAKLAHRIHRQKALSSGGQEARGKSQSA
jgi:hypothetical protein